MILLWSHLFYLNDMLVIFRLTESHVECWKVLFYFDITVEFLILIQKCISLSKLKSMRIRVLQRIKNKHENYSSTLSLSSQMKIWVYENWDTKSTRNFTVDSQKHWIYENFYHWFSKTLSLQEFKSHTNLNVSSMIRIQVIYDLQEILHESHVISLISSMMLELSLLSI